MSAEAKEIIIPYTPRPLQRQLHKALRAHRWAVAVCHRRFGKSVMAVNHLIRAALTCPRPRPRLAYLAPTYRMGKAIAWDYLRFFAGPIPGVKFNQSELRVDFPTGGQVRIYGADSPDSLRGLYLDGVILDEYGLMPPNAFSEVVRPALADREGWACFLGTPAGKNQFYDVVQTAQTAEGWSLSIHKASETGILPPEELAAARQVMTPEEYDQEFECSFSASVKGAIFARELAVAREEGRIGVVPYDPLLKVDTDWDLGVGDATAVWFSQSLKSGEVRLVDYYEASGEGLPHYVQMLQRRPYVYGDHWAPPDIQVRELGSGKSRLETAKGLGITFRITPDIGLEDGIAAARVFLSKCWFDQGKCKAGIDAITHYRRDYNTRLNEFKAIPVHDWASHGADAFRYLAVRHKAPFDKPKSASRQMFAEVPRGAGWMT